MDQSVFTQMSTFASTTLLSATVIAAIVSAWFSYAGSRKEHQLKYITDDRKQWRTEIRRIASGLQNISDEDESRLFEELGMYINPYGIGTEDVMKDGHIWRQIEIINQCEGEEKDNHKNRLKLFLMLLLKYDWERSKEEIIGNRLKSVVMFLSFANLIIISALHFIKDNDFNEYFILGVAALVLMPLVIVSVYQKGVPIKKGLKILLFIEEIALIVAVVHHYLTIEEILTKGSAQAFIYAIIIITTLICLFKLMASKHDNENCYKTELDKYIPKDFYSDNKHCDRATGNVSEPEA